MQVCVLPKVAQKADVLLLLISVINMINANI